MAGEKRVTLSNQSSTAAELDDLRCPVGESECVQLERLAGLQQQVAALSELAQSDPLTGLVNLRGFEEAIIREVDRSQRTGQALSLIMFDIDHFKQINDRWGHEAGNKVLKIVANLTLSEVRRIDVACRYGGEEFLLVLPDTHLAQGIKIAERLRTLLESAVAIYQGESITFTASFGVEEFFSTHRGTPEEMVSRVDHWLYVAKERGRNCVAHEPLVTQSAEVHVSTDEKIALNELFGDFFDDEE